MPRALLILLSMCFLSGLFFRIKLLRNTSLSKILASRIEVSTPVSSWKRAVEGVILSQRAISPYEGDAFHESPLSLYFYKYIQSLPPSQATVVFALFDIITACALSFAAYKYVSDLVHQESTCTTYKKNASVLIVKAEQISFVPCYVAIVYLFSPYAFASCGGKSTTVFLNCLLAFFIFLTCHGRWLEGSMLLALISYHSFYHISLLVAFLMCIAKKYEANTDYATRKHIIVSSIAVYFVTFSTLIYGSYKLTGSWQFLMSTYGFTLSVPDLTPNIGLFWYFFTEMFEHFRVFFLCTFQLNAFIYTVPLAIRLRREPMLLLFVHLILIALFKSYPSIGDVAFYLALLPIWQHLLPFMRQTFWVACVLVSCTLLAPTLWHLWIYSGSANANFYFAITLVFNTGQIFLLTDVLSAFIKREYYLLNGIKADKEGKLLLLALQ